MATLRTRNGTFYACFHDTERTPNEKRLSLKTKDKQTARALLAKWERLYRLAEADPWTDDLHAAVQPKRTEEGVTLSDVYAAFVQSRKEAGCTPETLRTYHETVERVISDVGDGRSLAALKTSLLRSYIHADDIAAATKAKRYQKIHAFLSFCRERYDLEADPLSDVTKPRTPKKMPVAFTPEELTALCEEIKAAYRKNRKRNAVQPGRLIWRIPLYWFALFTGLRRSEIARLTWNHVDLEAGTVTLLKQKGRRQQRFPICRKAVEILRRLERRSEYVFAGPYESGKRNMKTWCSSLSRSVKQYRRKAGLRDGLNFHSLRKGFCSELACNGANAHTIQRAARHADISTSLKYVALHDDSIRGAIDSAF